VTPLKSLDELAKSADLIVKGTVASDLPVKDAWFDHVQGFEAREAQLAVVSVIKGSASTGNVRFRHYAPTPGAVLYDPLHANLAVRRTYLVFASDAGGGFYRQLTTTPSVKPGEGVILAGDDEPHRGKTAAEAVWAELTSLLASKSPDEVLDAIHGLDERSGGRMSGLSDFARRPVLDLLRPLIPATTGQVQATALIVFGAQSPYTDDGAVPFFLAAIGGGIGRGLAPRPTVNKTDADVAAPEITAVADGNGPAERRALAIRVLGRSASAKAAPIARWSADPDPIVRCAAVLLAADAPDTKLIAAAATDPSAIVRDGAARAIGFAHEVSLIPTLDALLRDRVVKVRTAAALNLLSFSPDDAGAVMKAHLGSDYRSLFVNALALRAPASYLVELADVIEKDLTPPDWGGGPRPGGR
jgi:hypothetical protein